MSYLIALDDGHGNNTKGKSTASIPGLNYAVKENQFNLDVVNQINTNLRRCGFKTLLVAPELEDVSMTIRTDRANKAKADLLVSIHYNAYDGKWESTAQGVSVHVFPGYPETKAKGRIMLKHLLKGTPQVSRGIVESDFHMLRESHMSALLIENGFMDYLAEARLMISPGFREEVAREITEAICEIFGVPYVSLINAYANRISELKSQIATLISTDAIEKKAFDALKNSNTLYKNQLVSGSISIVMYKDKLKNAEVTLEKLTKTHEQSTSDLTVLQSKYDNLQITHDDLQFEIGELREEYAEMPPTYPSEIEELSLSEVFAILFHKLAEMFRTKS